MNRFVVGPKERSWLEVHTESHFPIQNLPFGIAILDGKPTTVSRVGDRLIKLAALAESGLIDKDLRFGFGGINPDPIALSATRRQLFEVLVESNGKLRDDASLRDQVFCKAEGVRMGLPFHSRGYIDFYSGIHHASNVGKMFRPDMAPLLPNYKSLPVAYNGRASSLYPSGTPIARPTGQLKLADKVVFEPCRELDFELEMGFYCGKANPEGGRVSADQAGDFMAGLVLVNDWSARDVQRWEYQPLGPFLAKSFATSVSPWLITLDALEPFRIQGMEQDPVPLDYLGQAEPRQFDIQLEVWLRCASMDQPARITKTNAVNLYWSMAQQMAHLTSNRTPIEPGDLCASGTISSETAHEDGTGGFGSLLELSYRGQKPIAVPGTTIQRSFLEDGDQVSMTGYAQGDGYRVGFGAVEGTIYPSE